MYEVDQPLLPDNKSKSSSDPIFSKNYVSKTTLFFYGLCEFSLYIIVIIEGFYLLDFLLDVAQISAYQAGTIMLISHFWDGFTDPIVGRLSDMTSGRWGRRRPWIFVGAFPLAVAYWLLWQVPSSNSSFLSGTVSEDGLVFYYLAVTLILNFTHNCVAIPYTALTPDLTPDYDERTTLTTARFFFGLIAGIISAFAHGLIITAFPEPIPREADDIDDTPLTDSYNYVKGYSLSATILSIIILIGPILTAIFIRENYIKTQDELPFWDGLKDFVRGLKATFFNRAFIILLCIYLMCWVVINFIQNNMVLYVKYVLKSESDFPYIILTIEASASVFLIVAQKVSKKIGKQKTYYIGMSTFICVLFGIYFVQPGQRIAIYVLGGIGGIGVATGLLVPWSMLPDVIDLDELRTGKRREGDLYAIFMLFQKIGLGLAMAVSSWILGWAGYVSPYEQQVIDESTGASPYEQNQPESVKIALKMMLTIIPAVLLTLSFIPMYFYPITKERHEDILNGLKQAKSTK